MERAILNRPGSPGTPGSSPPVLPAAVLESLWRDNLDDSELDGRDPEFIESYGKPVCDWFRRTYFRAEFFGEENVPNDPPFIAVANHSGAPILPDVWPLLSRFWELFSSEQPSYALVHDAAFHVPLVRNL